MNTKQIVDGGFFVVFHPAEDDVISRQALLELVER